MRSRPCSSWADDTDPLVARHRRRRLFGRYGLLPHQETDELGGGHGRAEQEALQLVAAPLAQELRLLQCLDAFGNHAELQALSHREDRGRERRVVRIGGDVADEGAVDLDALDREAAQGRKRGVSGSEVVESQSDAHVVELGQRLDRGLLVREDRALGQLQLELARGESLLFQDARHQLWPGSLPQLVRRNVDGDPDRFEALGLPAADLRTRAAQHPLADAQDQARILGDRDELVRANGSRARARASAAAPLPRTPFPWRHRGSAGSAT